METVLLGTPPGILARLGWDPRLDERSRIMSLARELVGEHQGSDPKSVRIGYETPAQFGHRVQLLATVAGAPAPLLIKAASFRAATVVAVAGAGMPLGLDIRDMQPDEPTLRDMRRRSHLFDEDNVLSLLTHWTRVQAVLAADGRGDRVQPQHVRLDTNLDKGWVPDRRVYYRLEDLSRDAWIITLAYRLLPAR